jgi:hypothetical protein
VHEGRGAGTPRRLASPNGHPPAAPHRTRLPPAPSRQAHAHSCRLDTCAPGSASLTAPEVRQPLHRSRRRPSSPRGERLQVEPASDPGSVAGAGTLRPGSRGWGTSRRQGWLLPCSAVPVPADVSRTVAWFPRPATMRPSADEQPSLRSARPALWLPAPGPGMCRCAPPVAAAGHAGFRGRMAFASRVRQAVVAAGLACFP